MTIISYESPSGDVWELAAPGSGRYRPVSLVEGGTEGFVGRVERSTTDTVVGVRSRGWKLVPLEITLKYYLRASRGEMGQVSRLWRDAWDHEQPGDYFDLEAPRLGRLVVDRVEGRFWTPVSDPIFPDIEQDLRSQTIVQEELSCVGLDGCWFGETVSYTGEAVVRAQGDRPLSPSLRLVWDGSATSVTFPSGLKLNLPAIGSERNINLDRGMSGQMTRPDGSVDTGGWSSLQGLVSGVSLRPGVESLWVIGSGLRLDVTPRFLSPWG